MEDPFGVDEIVAAFKEVANPPGSEARAPFDFMGFGHMGLPKNPLFDISYKVELGPDSDLFSICIRIGARSVHAELVVPDDCVLLAPRRGTLFSQENLISTQASRYRFITRYKPVEEVAGAAIVHQDYDPHLILNRWERELEGEPDEWFSRAAQIVENILGRDNITSLEDVYALNQFADESIIFPKRRERGMWTDEMLASLDTSGTYKGMCKERANLMKWLLCAGGIENRLIYGAYTGPAWDDLSMHTFNEIRLENDGDEFPAPLDWHKVPGVDAPISSHPFLHARFPWVYYVPAQLPKVVKKDTAPEARVWENGAFRQHDQERAERILSSKEKISYPCTLRVWEE